LRVLLAGGGSGGSATPLLAVADELRRRRPGTTLFYVGTRDGPEASLAAEETIPYAGVAAGKLRRYWSRDNLVDVFRVGAGIAESLNHVRRFRPSVAFGAGGFASVPPLFAASVLRVPVLIHQQDVVPGLANRLLVPFARWISVSLPETVPHFPAARTRLRGNPVRARIIQAEPARAFELLRLDPAVPVVLVTGGGTGALGLNRIVAAAAPKLVGFCQVLHLTGRGRAVPVDDLGPRYVQYQLLVGEMPYALAAATVVVSRAGLATISELSALRKPSIIVPMPASHQEANARALTERAAALVLGELTLSPEALIDTLRGLLASEGQRQALGTSIGGLMPRDAAARLADDLEALAESRARPV
jgi:UDP-N-acetylglucosamine--N-acetylmuramyl-(pentapeptide) pyrophosphoryl-undecaprenol N-acetylglucosamine transferase